MIFVNQGIPLRDNCVEILTASSQRREQGGGSRLGPINYCTGTSI